VIDTETILVNPNDRSVWPTMWVLWFGVYGDTRLAVYETPP
jgi:hypothetical protein